MKTVLLFIMLINFALCIWGPTCRELCYNNNGIICGYLSQSCCKEGYCAYGWLGQECEMRYFIPGCTTNWMLI